MTPKTAYRSGVGVGVAVATSLFLLAGIGALGVIGAEGDRADLMYLGVLAAGIGGTVVARLQPAGMVRAMLVTASATVLVGVIAVAQGKHQLEHSSIWEIGGLTAMFASLFAGSAARFRRAAGARANDAV